MHQNSNHSHKAQLDKKERELLEDVVTEMRDRIEANIQYQLENEYGLSKNKKKETTPNEKVKKLIEAIELEVNNKENWEAAYDQYITSVGYTIINRLSGLRCMEVRDFIEDEVTAFRADGLTPAADRLVTEEFMIEEEAVIQAYQDACENLAGEIEILFDLETVHSIIHPDNDTFKELCGMLDKIPDEVWRADDVLGWVYEYYNRPIVESLDAKNTLEPKDIGPANQFYTPHWVVRMLTDNSLGKLYLEATGRKSAIPEPEAISPEKRKERLATKKESPTVPELCTYLIPDNSTGGAPDFDHPSELRVIDPACGSGHFLLYAFDVLERIWWRETELSHEKIPAKILKHNLYGIDVDLRSCQLTSFNLYLKARSRAKDENGQFEMPNVDIVCADARVAEVEEGAKVLDDLTGESTDLRNALSEIIETFQHTEALGSLLDVSGTLDDVFEGGQTGISDWDEGTYQSLNPFLQALREAVDERSSDSFGEQNLKSFLNLLVVLSQEYDVTLMNPPYGSGGRMPDSVQKYIESNENYKYTTNYYINFFEACDRMAKPEGRTGMLIPWSFMFNDTFQEFREDFVGSRGSFDFFAEFGYDILDNATVGTVGTVVRTTSNRETSGTFIRLHDVKKSEKESVFINSSFDSSNESSIKRLYTRNLSEFSMVPGTPLSYWIQSELRSLYDSDQVLDKKRSGTNQNGLGDIRQGLATGDDSRFLNQFWEVTEEGWVPFAKGGADAWLLPRIKKQLYWGENGAEIRHYSGGNGTPSEKLYFNEGLTYTVAKRSGRRFGYLPEGSIFGHKGSVFIPDHSIWNALSYTNSHLFTYLMLTQTSERMWEVGFVSKVPWRKELEEINALENLSRQAVGHKISKRQYDFVSPHYNGPVLLDAVGVEDPLPQYDHTHRELRDDLSVDEFSISKSTSDSLREVGTAAAKHLQQVEKNLQSCANEIDNTVFDCFDITNEQRETVLQEIALRTIEDPREQENYEPEAVTEPSDNFPEQIKDLLLHFTLRAINDTDDGIIPISNIDAERDLLTHIEEQFERVWGTHATDRIAEADEVLGSRSASDEAYPNLREWLKDDLFEYHISKFDRTPIIWRFTTKRLVSDPEGEGFGCLVDYHQLDPSIFDRLQNQYLEPRRTQLREKRAAANSRRNNESLSTSEQAEATEEYEQCESGLEQLSVFEEQVSELAESNPRKWPNKNQKHADEAAERVSEFREQTETRLNNLEKLARLEDINMEDLFSPSFYETVQENKNQWINALGDLQTAFEAYAEDESEPVEAHLYDLFKYYDDLVGSAHFASNGILFMTYYFDQFEDPEQSQIGDAGDAERQKLLSKLAANVDEYTQLANEIAEDCDAVSTDIPNDWEERALSEVTTAGYQPVHKHGVAINITPLAEKDIVPEIVEDKVL